MRAIHRVTVALALPVAFATPTPAQAPFTLEQVLSAPFPTELVAAPRGAALAWVHTVEGTRNVWYARGPDFRGAQRTRYEGDDGQEVSSLSFTPGGAAIVYVRGGGPNRAGEFPNPTSEPDGAEQEIWIVAVDGGEPRKLAVGASPAVSPTGDRVAFRRRREIWTVSLADSAEPERLVAPRGGTGDLRWSPDGSLLAFTSNREDHQFVGLFDSNAASVRYLAPSVDHDVSPVWSPDGRRLAFIRIPNARNTLPFFAQREGEPWSIVMADVASGDVRVVFRAREGRGSRFRELSAESQLFWGADDTLVFPWEADGWTHLYAVAASGGEATLLTPGTFEVQHASLSPDRREVLFSSNQGDVDRKHLWRVAVTGGPARPVTRGEGIEWSPVMTADGVTIAFLASDARTPAHAAALVRGERRALAPDALPGRFPGNRLVSPQLVVFPAADGMSIHGQLFLPPDLRPGDRRPAVLFFHGGSRRQMLLGFHHLGYYHNAYALNQYLAARGFVVLSVNYRSGIGYGLEFREASNYGAGGASEFNDVLGAGLFLRGRPEVDPERIGLWGGSYGGYLTALGLARASDLFAAGVDIHGVHDWNVVIANFAPDYDPTARPEAARSAFTSSPMASVDHWRSPVLVIHGDDDRNVPFSETVDLVEALRERGVDVEQLVFPDEVHGFLLHRNWLAAYRAAAEFFDRRLAPGDGPRVEGR